MCTEKHVIYIYYIYRNFPNELNMGLLLEARVKKTVTGVDLKINGDSPGKRKSFRCRD